MNSMAKQGGQVLIILLGFLFLGGAATSVTTFVKGASPKALKERIETVVSDKKRKDEIVGLIDNWEKAHTNIQNQVRKEQETLLDRLTSYSDTRQDAQKEADKLNILIDKDDQSFIDLSFKMKAMLSREEWSKIWVSKAD
jgi:hypothetical protein